MKYKNGYKFIIWGFGLAKVENQDPITKRYQVDMGRDYNNEFMNESDIDAYIKEYRIRKKQKNFKKELEKIKNEI